MTDIITSRPRFARTRPIDCDGVPPVHVAQDFIGGPAPRFTFCGLAMADLRDISTPFRGMFGVMCDTCADVMVRMADAGDPV